jgi:NADH-quinone oxidoreductase subunit M
MKRIWIWFFALVAFFLPAMAHAHIALHTEDGRRGPTELREEQGRFIGSFIVENDGSEPLSISRVSIREDDAVRAVRGLSAKIQGGAAQTTVPPHDRRTIEVEWKPEAGRAPPQMFSHVVVTSSDESSGEVAMGIHAQRTGPLGPLEGHLLSAIILLPLLGALLALFVALVFPQGQPRAMRAIALGSSFGQVVLVALALRRFAPDFGRTMGNDGLQLIERSIWIRPLGIEWFVALDGHGALFLGMVALVGALSILFAQTPRQVEGHFGVLLATIAAASCAAVARDLALFTFAVAVASMGTCILAGGWSTKPRAAGTMAVFVLGAIALIVSCVIILRAGSTRTFLVDGSTVAHTFALPELERVSYTRSAGAIAGIPLVEIAVTVALVGFGALGAMFPIHPWLPEAAAAAPSPSSAFVVAIVPRLGALGMVRVLAQVLPEGTRWASTAIVVLGVMTLLHAAACALAETDLARTAARFSIAQTGVILVGIGSATPQGLAGATSMAVAGSLATVLVIFSAGVLEARTGERDASRLGGLLREMPLFAVSAMAGFFGCAALPATAPFWSLLLAVLGAFPTHPVMALFTALGSVVVAAAAFRTIERVFFGSVPQGWRRHAALEPFGGKFPDLRPHEAWTLGTLAVLTVLFGLWPSPMLGVLAGAIRDAVARANLGPLQLGF